MSQVADVRPPDVWRPVLDEMWPPRQPGQAPAHAGPPPPLPNARGPSGQSQPQGNGAEILGNGLDSSETSAAMLPTPHTASAAAASSATPRQPKTNGTHPPPPLVNYCQGNCSGCLTQFSCTTSSAGPGVTQPGTQVWEAEETCQVCKSSAFVAVEDEILLCDGPNCNGAYHLRCLSPPLPGVPNTSWLCPACMPKDKSYGKLILDALRLGFEKEALL